MNPHFYSESVQWTHCSIQYQLNKTTFLLNENTVLFKTKPMNTLFYWILNQEIYCSTRVNKCKVLFNTNSLKAQFYLILNESTHFSNWPTRFFRSPSKTLILDHYLCYLSLSLTLSLSLSLYIYIYIYMYKLRWIWLSVINLFISDN